YVETLGDNSTPGTISVALQGASQSLSVSYSLQSDPTAVSLQSGGQIPFPVTLVGTTAQATLTITNTGSSSGTVTGVSGSGGVFRLQTPLFPATLAAGQNVQLQVLYSPTAVATDSGQITITFASGAPFTVNLSGSGVAPSFTYQVLSSPPASVLPGGSIS